MEKITSRTLLVFSTYLFFVMTYLEDLLPAGQMFTFASRLQLSCCACTLYQKPSRETWKSPLGVFPHQFPFFILIKFHVAFWGALLIDY